MARARQRFMMQRQRPLYMTLAVSGHSRLAHEQMKMSSAFWAPVVTKASNIKFATMCQLM